MQITTDELRRMTNQEGLILQGYGGDAQEWIDGINELLTQEGILLEGTKFKNVKSFRNEGLTNLLFPFSDPSKKIILNNDNDEQRMLFESCTLKGKEFATRLWTGGTQMCGNIYAASFLRLIRFMIWDSIGLAA